MTFTSLRLRPGVTLYEVDGVRRDPTRHDARLTPEARESARVAVAIGAYLDNLTIRMSGKRPETVRA